MISTETKLNMSLEEIQYVERLEENNNQLKNYSLHLEKELNVLMSDYYSLKDNLEVLELEDWIIHTTYNNNEYVSGYLISEKKMWDTSNILSKTATKYGLFIITQSENIYYLPYSESYVNY
tara:strand:+ start:2828 stop:3190 length:363 start_codon:yes stop_codon:yes gene_type:complete